MPEQMSATRSGLFTADAAHGRARWRVRRRRNLQLLRPCRGVAALRQPRGAARSRRSTSSRSTKARRSAASRPSLTARSSSARSRNARRRSATMTMRSRAGHGAFLLDEERPDVFQASIGNLPPGKEVLLKLTYVTELTVDGHGLRFSIPTTVSPRYAPAEDQRGVGRPDSETLNPPVAWDVPYGLNLSVRLAMGGAHHRIESPSHPVERGDERPCGDGLVGAARRGARPRFRPVGRVRRASTRRRPGSSATTTAARRSRWRSCPSSATRSTPCDVMFLVDRSGSMEGTSIDEVRNALQLCLRSMIPGCTFNIVGFGSGYESLFPESRPYDEASLAEASAHVNAMRANLGGTEILPALQFVAGAAAPRWPAAPGCRPDRRRGHEHRRRACTWRARTPRTPASSRSALAPARASTW